MRSSRRGEAASLAAVLSLWMLIGTGGASLGQDIMSQSAPTQEDNGPPQSEFFDAIAETYPTVRGVVVARGDCIVLEYYRKDISSKTLSPVHSITKSVLSILVGIAIDKGYLRLDQKLPEVLPEAFDENVDPLARAITVRDLLTMTEGFDPAGAGDYASKVGLPAGAMWRWMLNRMMKYPPGTHFFYDDVGANLLSVVLSRAVNQDTARFAQHYLFDPLQIVDYKWISDAEGHLLGETGLYLNARDMAKIGLLYLWRGRWSEREIVSESYVLDSTSKHNDGGPPVNAAYGYLWWINKTKTNLDAFFAAGFKSQLIYVVPKRELVAAVAADSIPGGSQRFVNDIALPASAKLAASTQCIARLH
jgi:CubicO group peptidase (beta-lactamase class C family)